MSNLGRVFNVKFNRILEGYIIKNKNYKRKIVRFDGKPYSFHRLVAKAFPEICGEWHEDYVVHHLDFNPLNNRADNLKVCTKEEHDIYHHDERVERMKSDSNPAKGRIGRIGKKRSEETKRKMSMNRNDRKPVLQYTLDNQFIREWHSTREAERLLGYNSSNISKCCLGKQSSAYGYIWKHKRMI